jgi:hypothetical protein
MNVESKREEGFYKSNCIVMMWNDYGKKRDNIKGRVYLT